MEAGGDDKYVSRHAVAEGMSWDLGLTLFEDFAGNDRYQTCPHCLGTAAQSGLTFFIEHQGDDTYTGNFLPYDLEPVPNDYHSGVSFGLFLDKGKGADKYEKFKNDSHFLREKYHLLIDRPLHANNSSDNIVASIRCLSFPIFHLIYFIKNVICAVKIQI